MKLILHILPILFARMATAQLQTDSGKLSLV